MFFDLAHCISRLGVLLEQSRDQVLGFVRDAIPVLVELVLAFFDDVEEPLGLGARVVERLLVGQELEEHDADRPAVHFVVVLLLLDDLGSCSAEATDVVRRATDGGEQLAALEGSRESEVRYFEDRLFIRQTLVEDVFGLRQRGEP